MQKRAMSHCGFLDVFLCRNMRVRKIKKQLKILLLVVIAFAIVGTSLILSNYIKRGTACDGSSVYTIYKGRTYYGIIFPFKLQRFCGTLETVRENGLLSTNEIKDGELYGVGKVFYKNGQLFIQTNFKKNKLDGLMVAYAPNGQKVSEETYENGLQEGYRRQWYSNGRKKHIGYFTHGKKDGLFISWDITGEKTSENIYIKGKKHVD